MFLNVRQKIQIKMGRTEKLKKIDRSIMKNRSEVRVLISRNGKTRCWKSLIAASVTVIAYLVHTKHPDYFLMSFKGSLGRGNVYNTERELPTHVLRLLSSLF